MSDSPTETAEQNRFEYENPPVLHIHRGTRSAHGYHARVIELDDLGR